MTTPAGSTAPPPHQARVMNMLSRKPLTAVRAARAIAAVTLTVTVVAGVLIHWADGQNFPDIGRGMWWAVQTVTTVGYGDVVPETTIGRLIGAIVMVVGIAFLAVTTAAIASAFVEGARRREGDPGRLLAARLDHIGARLDAIDATLADRRVRGTDAG